MTSNAPPPPEPTTDTARPRCSPWSAYRVALVVIAGLVASGLLHLKITYDKAIHDAETLISALAIASEQHIGGSIAGIDSLLDELAATVRDGRLNDPRFSNDFAARLPSFPEVRFIGIVSANGMLQPNTWPPQPIAEGGLDVSDRKYFTAQRDAAGPASMVVGDPVIGLATKERSLHLSRPIRDKAGRFAGVVVASINPDIYAGFLASILYDEDGSCGLIASDGRMIARAPNHSREFGRNISDSDLIRIWAPRTPKAVAHLVAKTDGNDKLLAYRVMPEFSLMVTAGISRARALEDWRRMAMAELGLLATFSGMLLYWTRRIRRNNHILGQEQRNLEVAVAERSRELETARTLAESRSRQLGRINGELKRLAQVASHHLQEPLRSIVSCGQMVSRTLPDSPPALTATIEAISREGLALKERLSHFEKHVAVLTRSLSNADATPPEPATAPQDKPLPPGRTIYAARAVAAAVIVGLLGGNALQLRSDHRSAIHAAENITGAVVKTIEQHLQASFRRIDNLLNEVVLAVEDGRHTSAQFRDRMASRLATMPEIRHVAIADALGHMPPITWPDRNLPQQGLDISDREYFRQQAAAPVRGQVIVGLPRLGRIAGERSIQFSHPVLGPTGKFAGIAFASVNPDLYARFLDTVLLDESGGSAVITRDGRILARAPKHEEKFGIDISDSDLFTRWIPQAPSGIAHLVAKTDGNDKLLGYRVISGRPLVVTSGYSRSKALAEWKVIAVLATALSLIASAILFTWAWRADQHAQALSYYRQTLAAEVALRTAGLAAAHGAAERRSIHLAEANAQLHDLIRLIGAEMRVPMEVLAGHIATAQRLAGGRNPECDHWLAFISAGGIHLKALLRDYQRFVAALTCAPRLRELDSGEVAQGAASLIREIWDERVRFDIAALPRLLADRDMLLELFLQLFTNAVAHRKDTRQVTVQVAAEAIEGSWRFRVSDDGPGLPPVNSDHLFRAFETAHDRDPDSTGLGLPLCRIIVQCHGGRIWATSRPGKGSDIHFLLPARPDQDSTTEAV